MKDEGMANSHSSLILHPSSFWLMIVLLALFAASKAILFDTLDPDSFWHLRVAEQLHQQGIGPIVDNLSFASSKTPWTPYSWLAELGMKAIWDFGGYRAAVLTQAIMMACFVIFIALAAIELTRRVNDKGNPLAVIIGTAFAEISTLAYLSFRPATFAFMLLALCTWLLLRDRRMQEKSRGIWWIIPVTLLLTNCHFFAVLVPLWIGALVVGSIWEQNRPSVSRYSIMLGATTLACLATPMLPGAIRAVWQYQSADPMIGGGIIAELRPMWDSPSWIITMLIWLGILCYNRRRLRMGEWLWVIGMLILDLRLARFAPIFAPIASASLAATFPQFGDRVLNRTSLRIAMACALILGFGRIIFAFPTSSASIDQWLNRNGPDAPGYPTGAANFVAANVTPASGHLINEFSWGGFLEWRLGDRYQVLLDGRTQLYSPQFWQTTYLEKPQQSRPILADAHADAAIVPIQRSRFRLVLIDMGWKSAYRDDRAEVLLPPDSPAMNASISE
jgi:hypothetical protein